MVALYKGFPTLQFQKNIRLLSMSKANFPLLLAPSNEKFQPYQLAFLSRCRYHLILRIELVQNLWFCIEPIRFEILLDLIIKYSMILNLCASKESVKNAWNTFLLQYPKPFCTSIWMKFWEFTFSFHEALQKECLLHKTQLLSLGDLDLQLPP